MDELYGWYMARVLKMHMSKTLAVDQYMVDKHYKTRNISTLNFNLIFHFAIILIITNTKLNFNDNYYLQAFNAIFYNFDEKLKWLFAV